MFCFVHTLSCAIAIASCIAAAARAGDHGRTLEHTAVINAPIGDVWKAFTTDEGIRSWMVPVGEIDLRIGGDMRTSYHPDSTLDDQHTIINRIISFEPERMLSIRNVQAPKGFANVDLFQQTWSVMYFEPVGSDRTRLRIVGLGYGEGPAWDDIYNKFEAGNAYVLQQLQHHFSPPPEDAPEDATEDAPQEEGKANSENVLDLLYRLVGGEWIHESEQPNGGKFLVRNVIIAGPDGRSLIARGWLGSDAGIFEHGATQIWNDPETGDVRFQNINETGAIARGEITRINNDTVEWDWRTTAPNGEQQVYRVQMQFTGDDSYHQEIDHRAADGSWKKMIAVDFTRVADAPERFRRIAN